MTQTKEPPKAQAEMAEDGADPADATDGILTHFHVTNLFSGHIAGPPDT